MYTHIQPETQSNSKKTSIAMKQGTRGNTLQSTEMKLVRNLGHHDKQTRDIPYNTHRDTAIRELEINHITHTTLKSGYII